MFASSCETVEINSSLRAIRPFGFFAGLTFAFQEFGELNFAAAECFFDALALVHFVAKIGS